MRADSFESCRSWLLIIGLHENAAFLITRRLRSATRESGSWSTRHAEEVTRLLEALQRGDSAALDALFPLVYEELRAVAHRQRRRWQGDETLDTTALVHEAYLKLVDQSRASWESRAHFLATAAKAMRHILMNYARDRRAQKRGGDQPKLSLEEFGEQLERRSRVFGRQRRSADRARCCAGKAGAGERASEPDRRVPVLRRPDDRGDSGRAWDLDGIREPRLGAGAGAALPGRATRAPSLNASMDAAREDRLERLFEEASR